jgi:hypothetical protein
MAKMVSDAELSRQQRRKGNEKKREVISWFVEADGDLRPSFMWRAIGSHVKSEDKEDEAQRSVERGFRLVAYSVIVTAVTLFVIDVVRHSRHVAPTSLLYSQPVVSGVIFVVSLIALILLLIDVGTYMPRLFSWCAKATAAKFFGELARLVQEVDDQVEVITGAHVDTWGDHLHHVELLLEETAKHLLLPRLRRRVTARILLRLVAILCALALAGDSFSGLLHDDVIRASGYAAGIGFPEYLYFTVTAFFTIGFGDVTPDKHLAGYSFLIVIVSVFALVVYFVLTDIASSHGEFRSNIRAAAGALVLKHSAL